MIDSAAFRGENPGSKNAYVSTTIGRRSLQHLECPNTGIVRVSKGALLAVMDEPTFCPETVVVRLCEAEGVLPNLVSAGEAEKERQKLALLEQLLLEADISLPQEYVDTLPISDFITVGYADWINEYINSLEVALDEAVYYPSLHCKLNLAWERLHHLQKELINPENQPRVLVTKSRGWDIRVNELAGYLFTPQSSSHFLFRADRIKKYRPGTIGAIPGMLDGLSLPQAKQTIASMYTWLGYQYGYQLEMLPADAACSLQQFIDRIKNLNQNLLCQVMEQFLTNHLQVVGALHAKAYNLKSKRAGQGGVTTSRNVSVGGVGVSGFRDWVTLHPAQHPNLPDEYVGDLLEFVLTTMCMGFICGQDNLSTNLSRIQDVYQNWCCEYGMNPNLAKQTMEAFNSTPTVQYLLKTQN